MKKILLANIGNRNLYLSGIPLINHINTKEKTIKQFSQEILANIGVFEERLSIQIIQELLSQEAQDLGCVLLYGSDQADAVVNDQDTIYVANILKHLLQPLYPSTHFIVKPIENVSVVDNDGLLNFYRTELLQLLSMYPEAEFIICDAGGTAQQKSALKIMAEFILTSSKYRAYYQNVKTNHLEEVAQVEYRRIITDEQVSVLVNHGEYAAALALYESQASDSNLVRLLKLGSLRREMLTEDALKQVTGELISLSDWVKNFKCRKLNHLPSDLDDVFKVKTLFSIRERLDWVCFAYELKNYTAATLGFQVFTEFLVNTLLENQYPEFSQASENKKVGQRLLEFTAEKYPEIEIFFETKITSVSVPFLIKFCQCFTIGSIYELLKQLEKCNSWFNKLSGEKYSGLDKLRNDIAHDGEGVTLQKLQKAAPDFEVLLAMSRKILSMPPKHGYTELNELINNCLRK